MQEKMEGWEERGGRGGEGSSRAVGGKKGGGENGRWGGRGEGRDVVEGERRGGGGG